VFMAMHLRAGRLRSNRRAARAGYVLMLACLLVLVSGVALMRVGRLEMKDPLFRSWTYWLHVASPLAVVWLFVLHRLAGPRLRWVWGARFMALAGVLAGVTVVLHSQHPRTGREGPKEGAKYFEPSLARTTSGRFIPARTLMMDDYCRKCHQDAYQGWFHSAHHFSSFNNPPYLFSVRETRRVAQARDGDVKASRWCAGCHDVVPFLSGAFDDPNMDLESHPTANAGITCTACHAITHVNSTVGNAAYTMAEPIHYPFAFASNRVLQLVNETLVKAKPEFHKQTFLKPVHRTAEFCSTCHKVSIPHELNHYKE
jgi:hypothetical protein